MKKEIKDGDVLCGEIGLIFDSMNVAFKEYEWHQMFDFCKGLVATLTKKVAADTPNNDNNNINNNIAAKNPSSPALDDINIDDIPLDSIDLSTNSRPHIWSEPQKVFFFNLSYYYYFIMIIIYYYYYYLLLFIIIYLLFY